jgi:hypothetical protein
VFFYLAAGSFSPMNNAVGNSVSPLSEEPILAGLLAYWTARRQASGVGDKRDIDPTEIEPALLPFIGISEIEAETARIRYRLVGTGIAQRHGADPTGKYLDDVLQGAYLDYLIGLHRECCASRRPIYADSLSQRPTGQWIRVKRLLLPLTPGRRGHRLRPAGAQLSHAQARRRRFSGLACERRGTERARPRRAVRRARGRAQCSPKKKASST